MGSISDQEPAVLKPRFWNVCIEVDAHFSIDPNCSTNAFSLLGDFPCLKLFMAATTKG